MSDLWTQVFAALGGGGQGLGQAVQYQHQRAIDDENRLYRNAEIQKLNQQAQTADQERQRDAYVHGPEFQRDYANALQSGDPAAIGLVASKVAGHPSAGAIMSGLVPKQKATPSKDEWLRGRIQELTAKGMPLTAANIQARQETGENVNENPNQKNIDPLSPQGMDARVALAARIQAMKPKVETPDQVKMGTVADLAEPAANHLLSYYGEAPTGSTSQTVSAAASHVPLVGKALANWSNDDYQTALQNARVLGTQYLESLPKGRFQRSSVEDIMQQIAPNQNDTAVQRAQKAALIRTYIRAIKKRANNPNDLPAPTLDDAPLPPGMQP